MELSAIVCAFVLFTEVLRGMQFAAARNAA